MNRAKACRITLLWGGIVLLGLLAGVTSTPQTAEAHIWDSYACQVFYADEALTTPVGYKCFDVYGNFSSCGNTGTPYFRGKRVHGNPC